MVRPRRLLWLFLPTLVGGAFLLRAPDEFAAVRGGRPLDLARIARRDARFFAPDPRHFREERAYGFGEEAEGVESSLARGLFARKGWGRRFQITFPTVARAQGSTTAEDVRYYSEEEADDSVVLFRYEKPRDGMRLVAIVREGRDPWRHLKRRLKRMVGR